MTSSCQGFPCIRESSLSAIVRPDRRKRKAVVWPQGVGWCPCHSGSVHARDCSRDCEQSHACRCEEKRQQRCD
eukprot:6180136-Pleurochrysis_carterae.AAC.2